MADTYTLISSVTVGAGGASSMTFSSIPATYTDLKVVVSGRNTSTQTGFTVALNGTTTTSVRRLYGSGSSAASDTYNAHYIDNSNYTASTFGSADIYLPNYAGSNAKSYGVESVSETNATGAYMNLAASLDSTTSAISSITLTPEAGSNFAQYSTAYLYGIKNS